MLCYSHLAAEEIKADEQLVSNDDHLLCLVTMLQFAKYFQIHYHICLSQ